MARKIIPYPCDYRVTASVRRARRGGNVLVVFLCILIALLLGAGVFFAMVDDHKAIKEMDAYWSNLVDRVRNDLIARGPGEDPQDAPVETPPETHMTPDPTEAPHETPAPTAEPKETEEPFHTPAPTQTPAEKPVETPMPTPDAFANVPKLTPAPSPDSEYQQRMAKPHDEEALKSLPDIVEACMPGVVGILNYQPVLFSRDLKAASSGSGFVLTEDGYIVTNQHVIEDARRITVILYSGEEVEATLIGSDVMSDVAVLKIDAKDLKPLPIGDSEAARVGEFVLAIGNPLGTNELYGSVTFGIISATARNINIDGFTNEFIQTDAAINPGNSGGPLINMNGEVIGITNAKYFTAGYDEYGNALNTEGIGFALPIKNVMAIVDSLIKDGAIPRPGIGIRIGTRTAEDALKDGEPEGIFVDSVTAGGPADVAGLKAGDILKALDGVEMTQDEMIEVIRTKKIGEQFTFTVLRGNETLEIVITVGDLNKLH